MTKVEEFFSSELRLIRDDEIRSFVKDVYNRMAPDYFWTVPSSTSGKYHPRIALGEGGLVRHVKLAVWWAVQLMEALSYQLHPTAWDEIIAAVLLHDMKKNGESLDASGRPTLANATSDHGVYLATQIADLFQYEDERYKRIILGIAGHMGKWTGIHHRNCWPEFQEGKERVVCEIVYLADYCASRKVDEAFV